MARRGAGSLDEPDDPRPSGQGARLPARARNDGEDKANDGRSRPQRPEREIPSESDIQRRASQAVGRGRAGPAARQRGVLPNRPRATPDPLVALNSALGEKRGAQMGRRFSDAAGAFRHERFEDSRKLVSLVAKQAPDVADVRELHGLALYRVGRFDAAVEELEAFRTLSGSTEQHPVLADCHRALGHWADVDALWEELGEASPSAEIVTEGRIVAAGAKADQDDVQAAIRTLEKGWRPPKKPKLHHLRRAYALADLYERAGRSPRARELFRWVEDYDPWLADVQDRVRALS